MSPLLPPAAGAPAGDLPWRSDPAPPVDLHGPCDVAFRRLEPGWAERPALDLFAEVAARWPEAIACRDLDREVSFAALWSAARHLAASIDAAIPQGQPVGVLLPNQATYPAAVLACLATARPCVLIDRNHPQNRVAAIVRDAGLSAVVMYRGDIDNGYLLPAGLQALAIDDAFAAREAPPPLPDLPPAPPNAPDFIVYTSGSTGRPKGIVLGQRAVLHRAAELVTAVHLHNGDRVLSLASPGTIGGLQQIFEVMLCGATLVKLDLQRLGLSEVLQAIVGQGITMMFSTPAVWRAVAGLEGAREALAGLRCVQSSGDVLLAIDHELLRRVLPTGCAVLSVYGATEAPALLQWFVHAPPPDEARVPSGYPLPDIDLAILDEQGGAVADGSPGELAIRSAFTASGLWHEGRTVPGPFEPDQRRPGFKIYRTGDLVRRRSDGLYVVLGRRDRQIKLGGNRVELAEIETALRRLPAVQDAAVIARRRAESDDTEPLLLAFVVPRAPVAADALDRVRAGLAQALPSYMRPRAIHMLEALPLLPGRKIDEVALLAQVDALAWAGPGDGSGGNPSAPPAGRHAAAMVERAWRQILRCAPRTGVSFEAAGGDSLDFLQMVFRLERLAGRPLPLERFHSGLDADGLARALDDCLEGRSADLPVDRAAVFFFPPGGGLGRDVARFCQACGRRVPLRVVNYPKLGVLAGRDATLEAVADVAVRHIRRERQEGPLVLAGYSAGGDVAYAAVLQLAAAGRPVDLLVVFDTDASDIVPPRSGEAPRHGVAGQAARVWCGLRHGWWRRLVEILLSDRLFARPWARALAAPDPPLSGSWSMLVSTTAWLRLFARLHDDWRRRLRPTPCDVPVLLFRSDEPRPAEVPDDLGWSWRATPVRVVRVAGDHAELFGAAASAHMVEELVSAAGEIEQLRLREDRPSVVPATALRKEAIETSHGRS